MDGTGGESQRFWERLTQLSNPWIRDSHPLVEQTYGRIIGCLAGSPTGSDWAQVQGGACSDFEHARASLDDAGRDYDHRRGPFCALNAGESYGMGQTVRIRISLHDCGLIEPP